MLTMPTLRESGGVGRGLSISAWALCYMVGRIIIVLNSPVCHPSCYTDSAQLIQVPHRVRDFDTYLGLLPIALRSDSFRVINILRVGFHIRYHAYYGNCH